MIPDFHFSGQDINFTRLTLTSPFKGKLSVQCNGSTKSIHISKMEAFLISDAKQNCMIDDFFKYKAKESTRLQL